MDIKEIRKMNHGELNAKLDEIGGKLKDFNFKLSLGKVKNVREGVILKKDKAKILTELNARKLKINK